MREIPLTRGMVALVDDEDFALIAAFSWYAHPGANTFYGCRRGPRDAAGHRETLSIHRMVLRLPKYERGGLEADHIDRNGLNNTRANLRTVTHQGNALNRDNRAYLQAVVCGFCGKLFQPDRWDRKYCSCRCFGASPGNLARLAERRKQRWPHVVSA